MGETNNTISCKQRRKLSRNNKIFYNTNAMSICLMVYEKTVEPIQLHVLPICFQLKYSYQFILEKVMLNISQ